MQGRAAGTRHKARVLPACWGEDAIPAEVTDELSGWPGGGQVWGSQRPFQVKGFAIFLSLGGRQRPPNPGVLSVLLGMVGRALQRLFPKEDGPSVFGGQESLCFHCATSVGDIMRVPRRRRLSALWGGGT